MTEGEESPLKNLAIIVGAVIGIKLLYDHEKKTQVTQKLVTSFAKTTMEVFGGNRNKEPIDNNKYSYDNMTFDSLFNPKRRK